MLASGDDANFKYNTTVSKTVEISTVSVNESLLVCTNRKYQETKRSPLPVMEADSFCFLKRNQKEWRIISG